MKKLYAIILFALVVTTAKAQAPNWAWAKSAGGISDDRGKSCSTDLNGNIFVTGSFDSGSITFGTTTIINAGNVDMFIVKYDAAGTVLWSQSAGGTSDDTGKSVSIPQGGTDVFVTGYFWSQTITFGATTLTNTDITGNTADIFIVKYDASGNVLWAQSAGGTSTDVGWGVSTDAAGNVFVTGSFGSSAITFGTTTLTSAGSADIFIAKYSPSGNALWAQSAGGTSGNYGISVSTDASGNAYVAGYFLSPTITFGTTTLTNADITGNTVDIFIAKLDNVTGVNEWSDEELASVYPNPNNGMFNVKWLMANGNTSTINHQPLAIEVYNVLGEKVYVMDNGKLSIDISSHPDGIYFLQIKTEQGVITKKLILSR